MLGWESSSEPEKLVAMLCVFIIVSLVGLATSDLKTNSDPCATICIYLTLAGDCKATLSIFYDGKPWSVRHIST